MQGFFTFDKKLTDASETALKKCRQQFSQIESVTEHNQQKVLKSFIDNKVSESHFAETTGYGYGDRGRETLDCVFAEAMNAEAAIVRMSLASGTHTLSVALFGLLRPGDTMLSISGKPYDTIHSVIGLNGKGCGQGNLRDFGVDYKQIDLTADGSFDNEKIETELKNNKIKLVYIQRSRGYTLRPSLSVEKIAKITKLVKSISDAIVMVDNCYGEFVEIYEPCDFDADIIAGSLIKNAGGGIAKNGGYIAGKKKYVDLCAYRLTTPGLGSEVGATLNQNRNMFMGLFNAPHVVGEALKTVVFTAALFNEMGYLTTPEYNESRHCIVQSVLLNNPEALIAFCRGLQKSSPVDSFVVPEPWDMPGYDNKVIMAAGAFTMGSSIELSADAPLRDPYAVWIQGGLNFHSAKISVMNAAQEIINDLI